MFKWTPISFKIQGGKYTPTYLYNDLKSILEKDWNRKNSYALNSIEKCSPALTNNKITDKNIRCNYCATKFYQDIIEKN